MTKFHICKTPHTYGGMRWSIMERNGNGLSLTEICRAPCMADATVVCAALNHMAKDRELWSETLGKAATAFTKMEERRSAATARMSSARTKAARHGNGSAAATSD